MSKYTEIANDDSYWKKLGKKEKEVSVYMSKEMQKEYQEAVQKAMEQAGVKAEFSTTYSGNTANGTWVACWGTGGGGAGIMGGHLVTEKDFIPTKIIYSCPATICYFPDGTKEVVKVTPDEEYVKEVGVMACIMKKVFKSRRQFLKLVASGTENEEAEVERVLHNGSVDKIKNDKLFNQLKAFTTKLEK